MSNATLQDVLAEYEPIVERLAGHADGPETDFVMRRDDYRILRDAALSARSAKVSPSDPMAGRLEILAKRLKDCDYADRGTIQCGAAGNANLVRYNGEDIVGCAHVYDERDRLLLGWLAENAQRILDALSARSAIESRENIIEECARECDEYAASVFADKPTNWFERENAAEECAKAIRALKGNPSDRGVKP